MKRALLLLSCPVVIVLVVTGGISCGSGSIGDGEDVCPGGELPVTVYRDSDGDGYGDPDQPMPACEALAGFVSSSSDCLDSNPQVHPDGVEICGDKLDNDCVDGDPCALSLLAHWPLDDSQGSTARDVSGHDHEGTLQNGPEWSPDGPYLHFDGTERYVEVPHSPAFVVDEGTVSLWFRVETTNVAHGLWSKDSSGLDTGGHLTVSTLAEVVDATTGEVTSPAVIRVRLQHSDSAVGNNTVFSPGIEPYQWYHVVFVFGPEGMRLHVDNELVDANPYSGGLGSSAGDAGNHEPIVMGAGAWGSDDFSATPISSPHKGDLRDVRLYNRPLSADEIGELHELSRP